MVIFQIISLQSLKAMFMYYLITFLRQIWFNNYKYTFGGKIQTPFLTPPRAIDWKVIFLGQSIEQKSKKSHKNIIALFLLQKESLETIFGHLNHATFQIIGISVTNGPYLQLISHCVIASINFVQKILNYIVSNQELYQ